MGVYEGFYLDKYADIQSIRPTQRRLDFLNQIHILLDQKMAARLEFDPAFQHTKFNMWGFPYGDIEENTLINERWKHVNHSPDEFIQGIIAQRKEMISKHRAELCSIRNKKLDENLAELAKKRDDYDRAMEITEERQREREAEQWEHEKRLSAANSEVKVYAYNRRKEREKRAARKAKEAAQIAAHDKWKVEQKKQLKKVQTRKAVKV
jgi:hypothetical protein